MCDLLWSDPEETAGWGVSPRGAGYLFGSDVVANFNQVSKIYIYSRKTSNIFSHSFILIDNAVYINYQ
ncbi:unnamed protein product [Trichobilharzia regenti]|nr:unnamed protein product [Trichobilharzia regenti]